MLASLQSRCLSLWSVGGQFGRFLLVGTFNFGLDFAVYYGLTRYAGLMMLYLLANALSFVVANISSYLLNSRWTFGGRNLRSWPQYGQFLFISLLYLGVIELGLWLLVNGLGWFDLLSKFLVNGTAAVLYFMVLRRWVFRGED